MKKYLDHHNENYVGLEVTTMAWTLMITHLRKHLKI